MRRRRSCSPRARFVPAAWSAPLPPGRLPRRILAGVGGGARRMDAIVGAAYPCAAGGGIPVEEGVGMRRRPINARFGDGRRRAGALAALALLAMLVLPSS